MTATPADQPLVDQTVLITGATAGIGHHTARTLAICGARVMITGRDPDTGQHAAAAMCEASGRHSVTFLRADHSTVGGNQDLADRVRAAVPGLDLLVNNVGGLYPNRWQTPDGYEATLAMNFVGPYALTASFFPCCVKADPPAASTWSRPGSRCGRPTRSATCTRATGLSAGTRTPTPSC